MRKATCDQLLEALQKIILFYNHADVKISLIHTDNEFRGLEEIVDERFEIKFNFSASDEHVPDIKRANRTLPEHHRCEYPRSPY